MSMNEQHSFFGNLPLIIGVVKSLPETAASRAASSAAEAKGYAESAATDAQTASEHAWGVSVQNNTLKLTAPV